MGLNELINNNYSNYCLNGDNINDFPTIILLLIAVIIIIINILFNNN